ncbi:DUF899 domain-containing protein [Allokutzneria sp. NRRL B-24872]|uniref:DUF899 domain-containing protein n=1 Tax=Allokutzneria sp. NRRL B-24872 TaxID=1137961 RepID=UPI000A38CC7D|nr:DUF899 domain-containing protein [Allokutzneria sp. NRRL B-24872]
MNRPPVVSAQEWQAAREALLVKEKEHTRALDALAAERRRLPMVRLDPGYRFTAPDGSAVDFAELFEGRRQLVVYHFMLEPGSDHVCDGCSSFTDNIAGHPHLSPRDTTLALMSPAPQEQISLVRKRFGWTIPWYSAFGNSLYADLGLGGMFGVSVFLRDGDEIFRSYYTSGRGVDRLRVDLNLLDLTPYGRQEEWEDSPEGWPQTPTMQWMRHRDEYGS